jgi:dethiobiotin synthetase
MKNYFITATGTDIGKTFISCALAYAAHQQSIACRVYKPILSGFDAGSAASSDTGHLLEAMGEPLTQNNIEALSPWRYSAPLSPNMAAEKEGKPLPYDAMLAWCGAKLNQVSLTLIEGVGGVMVPLNNTLTVRDWMGALNIPVILVTGNYLGSISHTLTAVEVLRAAGIRTHTVVISESANATVSMEDTFSTLRQFIATDISLVAIARAESYRHAQVQLLLEGLMA